MKPLKMMLVVTGNRYLLLSFGFLVHVFGNGSSSFSMIVCTAWFSIFTRAFVTGQGREMWVRISNAVGHDLL